MVVEVGLVESISFREVTEDVWVVLCASAKPGGNGPTGVLCVHI